VIRKKAKKNFSIIISHENLRLYPNIDQVLLIVQLNNFDFNISKNSLKLLSTSCGNFCISSSQFIRRSVSNEISIPSDCFFFVIIKQISLNFNSRKKNSFDY